MGGGIRPREYQMYNINESNFNNTKEKFIVTFSFKTDSSPILVELIKGKGLTELLAMIFTANIWYYKDGCRAM